MYKIIHTLLSKYEIHHNHEPRLAVELSYMTLSLVTIHHFSIPTFKSSATPPIHLSSGLQTVIFIQVSNPLFCWVFHYPVFENGPALVASPTLLF